MELTAWEDHCQEDSIEARFVCCGCNTCICRGDPYFDTDSGGKECELCNGDRRHTA